MKVLFLGAGASNPAGYPPGSALLDSLQEEYEHTPNVNYRQAWERFVSLRESAPPLIARILRNPNPEVSLSAMDLMVAASSTEDHSRWEKLMRSIRAQDHVRIADINSQWDDPERKALGFAAAARRALLECIDDYFGWRSYLDQKPEAIAVRAYLARLLRSLERGDAVITTNWDTLTERCLWEAGLWSPADGYGFPVSLCRRPSWADEVEPVSPPPSNGVLLKLHGSCGWRRNDDQMYIDHVRLFNTVAPIPFRPLYDEAEPRYYDAHAEPLILHPSYLKAFTDNEMQAVWRRASLALHNATVVHAIGFSLPEEDMGVRVLLNGLGYDGRPRVLVDALGEPVLERWRRFLGPNVVVRDRRIQEVEAVGV